MAQSKRYGTGSMPLFLFLVMFHFTTPLLAVELKGRTDFSDLYSLNSAVSGIVSEVYVSAGQLVKRDDVLLKLDARPFQAKVAEAKSVVTMRKPVRDQMLTELEKAQELYDRDSLARVVLQNAENDLQIAEGELAAAEAKLELAAYQLSQSTISAPDDLLVLDVNTHPQQYINTEVSDEPLVVLANHYEMLAIAYLGPDQWDAGLVGKSAQVDYLGRKIRGRVISLEYRRSPESDSPDGFELRVIFVASGEIPANMPVTIDIQN
jgi:multidrug resistance efflux pump